MKDDFTLVAISNLCLAGCQVQRRYQRCQPGLSGEKTILGREIWTSIMEQDMA